jgi:hypothetical protein
MTDAVREQVLGYLLGALDDAEMEQVRARLESEEAYRQEWIALGRHLQHLEAVRSAAGAPPSGLAQRTCQFIFSQIKSTPRRLPRRAISPQSAPPSRASGVRLLDVAAAAVVFVLAGALTFPAIQSSRFHSRLAVCSDNLRELGTMLTAYSEANHGRFPAVPTEGKLAAAGVYAPLLARSGLLADARRLVCPDSSLAAAGDFRVPTIAELQAADTTTLARLRQQMGGSYGYCIGYVDHGAFEPTRNLHRAGFAMMADAPCEDRPGRQSDNHGGRGQNVLFEDGHVQFLTTSRPSGARDDIFANDDDEVAAGVHQDDSVIASSGVTPVIYVKGARN